MDLNKFLEQEPKARRIVHMEASIKHLTALLQIDKFTGFGAVEKLVADYPELKDIADEGMRQILCDMMSKLIEEKEKASKEFENIQL